MTPSKTAAILRRLADDWRHEEAQLCKQFGDVILPQSMRARRIKDTEAINAAVEMIDRLETAESEAIEQARLNGMGSEREAALMAKLEAAEKTNREWLRANALGGWIDNLRIENEALRAEVIHIKEVEFPRKAQAVADGWRGKCERLEAKIVEMEKQYPICRIKNIRRAHYMTKVVGLDPDAWLYLAPGAQTAPSVPELIESLRCACNYIDNLGGVSQQYRAMIAAAPEAKP